MRRALVLAATLAVSQVACAGHSSRTEGARTALDAGRPDRALSALNEELEVPSARDLPKKVGGDATLLLLDRAMVLQALASTNPPKAPGNYQLSSRDLETADKQIEILDLSRNAAHDIGKYLFSDETGPYKAPTYEKLMINTMNMVNYLVRGDLGGAKVEARRLAVMQRYIDEHEGRGASLTGPGSYLAGFAFEKSGDAGEALRFYDEALEYGSYASLAEPVRRLSQKSNYRSPRLRALIGESDGRGADAGHDDAPARNAGEGPGASAPGRNANGNEPAKRPTTGAPPDDTGEILVVIEFGRVPAKIAKRIPIGLALTYVSGALSPTDAARANYLAAQGLVTWINYPELGRPRGTYDTPGFALDGGWQKLEGALAVDLEAKKAWEEARGAVIASAITRMIARVAAGEAVRRTTGGVLGAVLSLGTQATLTAVDTPDTRSWSTLPARIAIGRLRVPAGVHYVDLEARDTRLRRVVTVAPGGWAVLNLTVLR